MAGVHHYDEAAGNRDLALHLPAARLLSNVCDQFHTHGDDLAVCDELFDRVLSILSGAEERRSEGIDVTGRVPRFVSRPESGRIAERNAGRVQGHEAADLPANYWKIGMSLS